MQPENLKFGGGPNLQVVHPLVLIALLVAAVLILFLPKRHVIVPVLVMAFMVPIGQQFYVGGLHVLILRIVILIALIRALFSMIFSRVRGFAGGFGSVDKVFLVWTFFHVVTFFFLFSFQSGAVVNQLGFVWDTAGGFLVMRFLIQDEGDIERVIKSFAFIVGMLAVCMLNERFQMQNIFGFLGGVPIVSETRDGLVRAQAAFSHPLLAGTFGATLLPLFFLLWHGGKSKALAVAGIASATIMVICASSSTPFLAYAAGIGAVCFWPFRGQMRLFRWGIVFAALALHLVMKAPVWFLIAHISLFGSSSSDHRAYLVDTFIKHFADWWLVGTNDAGKWGWGMWDTSNQFIAEGEGGGLVCFALFLAMISFCFSRIGKARKAVEGDRAKEWYFWFLGAALFANVVGFFGVSYFDQTKVMWFALLAVICTATSSILGVKELAEQPDDGSLVNSRFAPVSPSPDRKTSQVYPYKHA